MFRFASVAVRSRPRVCAPALPQRTRLLAQAVSARAASLRAAHRAENEAALSDVKRTRDARPPDSRATS